MELSYENADALVRTIGGTSAEHLGAFVESLIGKQYSVSYVCQLARHALAFGRWCEARNITLHALSENDIVRYQRCRQQRRSRCLETRRRELHALELLLGFLRDRGVCPAAYRHVTAAEEVAEGFARYLHREQGLAEVSQLLWAAQGETHADGYRAAPSAGALYPLELYLVVGAVEGLSVGVYHYRSSGHELVRHAATDVRKELASAAYNQSWLATAPAILVFTGVYERTVKKYGKRGLRYVHMDAGHAAQNVYLQAEARSLGTVIMGAFDDARVRSVLNLPDDHQPLGLMPVGRR